MAARSERLSDMRRKMPSRVSLRPTTISTMEPMPACWTASTAGVAGAAELGEEPAAEAATAGAVIRSAGAFTAGWGRIGRASQRPAASARARNPPATCGLLIRRLILLDILGWTLLLCTSRFPLG